MLSKDDGRVIEICHNGVMNLLPRFSRAHQQVNVTYGAKSYSLLTLKPKDYVHVDISPDHNVPVEEWPLDI